MLVPCPSCGKRVSDRAPQCPFCKVSLGASKPVSASETAPPIVKVDSAIRDGDVTASLVSSPPPAKPAAGALPEVAVPRTASRFSQDECLKRAEMARNQALFGRALEFADEAIAADPRKPMAWAAKAEALFGLKRFADAAAHAKKVVEMNPKFGPGWVRLAASYDALGAFELALLAWDKAVELTPWSVLNWNGRGICLANMGRLEDALACHDKALALDPRFSPGKFYKGLREADLGRRDDALKSLQQFLAQAPPNLAALAQEARQRIQELKA